MLANKPKPGLKDLKPPDLWINHENLELANIDRNSDDGCGSIRSRRGSTGKDKHSGMYHVSMLSLGTFKIKFT